eukprot:TRINITY_DN22690_c0_g1_i1.p1 TRINITY_DN22690_c0_g1~~TRINITY_DN22690_c0_g1_i1.p1  ORF type:complete len:685 (+),score=218.02 TRINITY_DN22690_c0_g1_i1:171-2225(+)
MSDTHWGDWVDHCDADTCEHAGVVSGPHWGCCGTTVWDQVCADAEEEAELEAEADASAAGHEADVAVLEGVGSPGVAGLLDVMHEENIPVRARRCQELQRLGRGLLWRRRLLLEQVERIQRAARVAAAKGRTSHLRAVRAVVDRQAAALDRLVQARGEAAIRRLQRVGRSGFCRPALYEQYTTEMASRHMLFRFVAGWGGRNRLWNTLVAKVRAAQAEWDAARSCENASRQATRQGIFDVRALPQQAARARTLKEKVVDVLAFRANLRPAFPSAILPPEIQDPNKADPPVNKDWTLRPDAFEKPKPVLAKPKTSKAQQQANRNLPPSFPPALEGPRAGGSLLDDYLFVAPLGEPITPPIPLYFINSHEVALRQGAYEPGMLRASFTVGGEGYPVPLDIDYSLAEEGVYLVSPTMHAEGFHLVSIRLEEVRGVAGVGGAVLATQVAVDASTSKMLTDPTAARLIPRPVWQMVRKLRLVLDETGTQSDARVVALLAKIRAASCFGDVLRFCQNVDHDCFWVWELFRERQITRFPVQLKLPAVPAELRAFMRRPGEKDDAASTPPASEPAPPAYPTSGALFDNPSVRYPIKTLSKLEHADYLPASLRADLPPPVPVAGSLAPLGSGKVARRRPSVSELLPWIPGGRRKATQMHKSVAQHHEKKLLEVPPLPPLRLAPSAQLPPPDTV